MIKLEIEVTPDQMIAIGQLLNGYEPIVLDTPLNRGEIDIPTIGDTGGAPTPPSSLFNDGEAIENNIATSPPPPPISDGEVELGKGSNGQMIPWDARIHGKAKKQNADGSWRLLQGIDRDTLVPQVEAELVETQQAGKPIIATPPASVTSNQIPPPPAVVPTIVPVASSPTTFAELLPVVTAAKAAGTLTDEKIVECCAALGLAQFGLIATRPDLIPQAVTLLGV